MGLNNDKARRVIFDIETAPIDGAADYLEPVSAPANYKDPDAIARYVKDAAAKEVSRCSLDVDLCRIVAIGGWVEGYEPFALTEADCADETELVCYFWNTVEERHLVGFNCLSFDLPVLFRRSLYLGVKAPLHAYSIEPKWRPANVTDLQMRLSYNGAIRLRGLSFYCKRFGIDVSDTLTGADIGQAVADGRWQDVRAHVTADIQKTAQLAAKLGAFTLTPVAEAVF
jgi:predicted PolB exonuclease-like 3'-5' exonuclease